MSIGTERLQRKKGTLKGDKRDIFVRKEKEKMIKMRERERKRLIEKERGSFNMTARKMYK